MSLPQAMLKMIDFPSACRIALEHKNSSLRFFPPFGASAKTKVL